MPKPAGSTPNQPSAGPERLVPTVPTVGGSIQMGFGIACGMLLFGLVVLVGFVLVAGLGLGATRLPALREQAQVFEGTGSADSEEISLVGTYRIEWQLTPPEPGTACGLRVIALWMPVGNPVELLPAVTTSDAAGQSGSRDVVLAAGTYRLRVETACRWRLRLVG